MSHRTFRASGPGQDGLWAGRPPATVCSRTRLSSNAARAENGRRPKDSPLRAGRLLDKTRGRTRIRPVEGDNAAIICAEGRYEELSRIAREAGFTPFKADVEKATLVVRSGDCTLILTDRASAEVESLPAPCVLVDEEGRLSLPKEAVTLSVLGGLGCTVHAIARKFSELAAEQEEIRRQQARISNFLTGLQDGQAPKELVEELSKLKGEAGGYADIIERVEDALMETREKIDELLRLPSEREGEAKEI